MVFILIARFNCIKHIIPIILCRNTPWGIASIQITSDSLYSFIIVQETIFTDIFQSKISIARHYSFTGRQSFTSCGIDNLCYWSIHTSLEHRRNTNRIGRFSVSFHSTVSCNGFTSIISGSKPSNRLGYSISFNIKNTISRIKIKADIFCKVCKSIQCRNGFAVQQSDDKLIAIDIY